MLALIRIDNRRSFHRLAQIKQFICAHLRFFICAHLCILVFWRISFAQSNTDSSTSVTSKPERNQRISNTQDLVLAERAFEDGFYAHNQPCSGWQILPLNSKRFRFLLLQPNRHNQGKVRRHWDLSPFT